MLDKQKLLEWLEVEIDLSKGNHDVLKADTWTYEQMKKAILHGEFDIREEAQ